MLLHLNILSYSVALGVTFSNCTEGSIRLANGTLTSYSEGRLDVCINGVWGSVCYGRYTYQWSRNAATVVCRQLGHQPTGNYDLYDIILIS